MYYNFNIKCFILFKTPHVNVVKTFKILYVHLKPELIKKSYF